MNIVIFLCDFMGKGGGGYGADYLELSFFQYLSHKKKGEPRSVHVTL